MSSAEVDELSRGIALDGLQGYWDAVVRGLAEVIGDPDPADLDAVVDPAHVERVVRAEGVLVPAGAGSAISGREAIPAAGSSCRPRCSTPTATCSTR